jgi:hypothetical protein
MRVYVEYSENILRPENAFRDVMFGILWCTEIMNEIGKAMFTTL